MFYYAFHHTFGVNMRDGNNHRIGYVLAFSSKRNRDKYVNDEIDAETIDHKTARWYMIDRVAAAESCAPSEVGYTTRELIEHYNAIDY